MCKGLAVGREDTSVEVPYGKAQSSNENSNIPKNKRMKKIHRYSQQKRKTQKTKKKKKQTKKKNKKSKTKNKKEKIKKTKINNKNIMEKIK